MVSVIFRSGYKGRCGPRLYGWGRRRYFLGMSRSNGTVMGLMGSGWGVPQLDQIAGDKDTKLHVSICNFVGFPKLTQSPRRTPVTVGPNIPQQSDFTRSIIPGSNFSLPDPEIASGWTPLKYQTSRANVGTASHEPTLDKMAQTGSDNSSTV